MSLVVQKLRSSRPNSRQQQQHEEGGHGKEEQLARSIGAEFVVGKLRQGLLSKKDASKKKKKKKKKSRGKGKNQARTEAELLRRLQQTKPLTDSELKREKGGAVLDAFSRTVDVEKGIEVLTALRAEHDSLQKRLRFPSRKNLVTQMKLRRQQEDNKEREARVKAEIAALEEELASFPATMAHQLDIEVKRQQAWMESATAEKRRFAKARKDEQAARRLLVECEDLRASIAEVEAEIEACIKEQHTILAQRPALPGPQRNVALCEEYETDFAELILLMLLSVGHEGMQGRRRGRERASVSAGSPFALLGERVARAPRDPIYHGSGFAQSSSSLPPPHALDGRTSVSAGSSQMFLNDRLPLVALSQLFAVLEEFILFNDRDDDLGRELKQGKSNIEVLAYLLEAGVLTWLLEMLSWFAEGGGRGFEKEDELICAIQVAVRLVNSMVGVSRTSKPITAVMQDQFSGRGVVGVVVDALSRCLVWAAESEQLNATEREDALQSISNLTEMLGEMLRFAVGWADVVEGEKQEERGEVEMEGDLVVANGEERNGERKLALDERGKRDTERDRHRHYRQQQDKLAGDVRTLKTTATAAAKVLLGWISVLLPHVLAWQEGDVYDLDAEESNSQLCKIFRCLGLSLIECTGGETLFEDFRFHKLLANCAAILAGPSLDDQLKTFARDFSRIASHVIFVSDRRLVEMHLLRLHAVRSGLHESIVHGIPMHTASVYPCLERLRIEYEVWTGRTEALVKESQKGISIAIAEARAAQEEEERRRKRWERRRERRMRRKIEKRVNEVKAKAEREAKWRPKRSKFDRRVLPPVNMLEERRKDGEGKLVEPEKRFQVRKLVAQSRSTEAILRGVDLDEVRDKRRKKARDANKGVRKRIQISRSGGGLPGI